MKMTVRVKKTAIKGAVDMRSLNLISFLEMDKSACAKFAIDISIMATMTITQLGLLRADRL
jgi:hypothetical protein